ncbi:MAG: HD domain-containing protein [Lachnospiraceae bacterium]|nr:HD domain-containing protein [Lachnospiraceae bacterium]
MRFINTLKENDHIAQVVYLVRSKATQTSKTGKPYHSLTLQDKTGTVDGKIWDTNSGGIEDFEAGDFVAIDADVTFFNVGLQLNIRRLRKAGAGEYSEGDYFPTSVYDIDKMYEQLLQYITKVKNASVRKLLESFYVDDEEVVKRFKMHSAAKTVHHSFIGGLLEHTLGVTRLCYFYLKCYPKLNGDLLLAAAMLHDIGKLREISDFPGNDYTDDGQLIGHIVLGCEMVSERIRQIPDFPAKTAAELRHCILAHHGNLEYGSPKKPALMEAMALYLADTTDARMELFTEQFNATQSMDWLGFNKYVDANIRKTTPIPE